ncbi:MAG: ABC transporter ATP-binding protein [bacterium]
MVKITIEKLHKYMETPSGTIKILENVNLEVAKGEFIAIMGPSGAGKSTLLYMVGCLDVPTFGHLYLDEVDVTEVAENVREKIRLKHIGFIFQNYHLLPTLNVLENVTLPMHILGTLSPAERESRGLGLLRLVGLEERAQERPSNLSGGQQQRIAIARAMANAPGLILADEPTGNLDAKTGKEIMEVIRSISENQGITTILVTHDPKIASSAQKNYYLVDGKIHQTVL